MCFIPDSSMISLHLLGVLHTHAQYVGKVNDIFGIKDLIHEIDSLSLLWTEEQSAGQTVRNNHWFPLLTPLLKNKNKNACNRAGN